MNHEVDAYHPRYTRTEYLTYEARERRRRRMGWVGAALILLGVVGLLILVTR